MALKALIWDVDGTLAETERDGHRVAFNQAFEAMGVSWRWSVERYGQLLEINGGRERLIHDIERQPTAPADAAARERLVRALHEEKNRRYATLAAAGSIALRPGVRRLLDEAEEEGVLLGIATTTSRVNLDALLRASFGGSGAARFAALVCGEDAPVKKPNPMVYEVCLQRLGIDPESAIAIEDSPNGLRSARAAGVPTLITRSAYFGHLDFPGAMATVEHLDDDGDGAPVDMARLRSWHDEVTQGTTVF